MLPLIFTYKSEKSPKVSKHLKQNFGEWDWYNETVLQAFLLIRYFQVLLPFLKNVARYMEIIGYFAAFFLKWAFQNEISGANDEYTFKL